MAILYLECGATIRSPYNTGIQRVVKNIINNKVAIEEIENINACVLVEFRNDTFYMIDLKKEHQTQIESYKLMFNFCREIYQVIKLIAPRFIAHLMKNVFIATSQKVNELFTKYVAKNKIDKNLQNSLSDYQQKFRDQEHVLLLLDASWDKDMWLAVRKFKENGGKVCAVQYDMIPLIYPEVVEEHTRVSYVKWWSNAIHSIDGVICISDAVRQDFYAWQMKLKMQVIKKEAVDFFYLGADFLTEDPIVQVTQSKSPFFLLVGSIEPRKNHALVLEAFDILWEKGIDANLVICFGNSWMSDDLIKKMMNHDFFNKKLFLFNKVSDKDLIWLYQKCTAAIMASYAEGFGLPIIEASQCGAKVICNDIPVFREIGGNSAVYFEFNNMNSLSAKIKDCLIEFSLNEKDKDNKSWITWVESAKMLATKTMQITGN